MHRKPLILTKKLVQGDARCKYKSKQISFSDFGQPVGLEISPDNGWVKKSETILWAKIELKYAKLFANRRGNVAKPLHLALGALIIQLEFGFSNEETALMIQESPYLQYFCGFGKYEYKLPFDPSLMIYFRKPRTYKKQARKDYLNMVRKKKKTSNEIRKGIRKQLQYLARNLKSIDSLLGMGKNLSLKSEKRLGIVRSLFEQQKYMFDHRTHSVDNRIVSLSQPYLRPIVKGKIKAAVEFGAKLDISVCGGFTRLENQSF